MSAASRPDAAPAAETSVADAFPAGVLPAETPSVDPPVVCLVAMPWQALDSPSLPLGLLNAVAAAAGFPRATTYHGSLHWAEYLLEATGGEIGPPEYTEVSDNGLFDELGDWVFTGVLHDDPDFGGQTLRDYAARRSLDISLVERMRGHADAFIDEAVERILATDPSVVGFTSTFMQNVPSLATALRLKRRAPHLRVVFGGGNCDGDMGTALHRNYPFVDYVVRGEGEGAWPFLLAALAGDLSFAEVPGLCWRDGDGVTRTNQQPPAVSPRDIPMPDFEDWFARMGESAVNEYVEPKLVLEASRGCWWGEKHQCTFCGLNGSLMRYRAKSPDTVLEELTTQVLRHRVLDVIMVDNIISDRAFQDVLPRMRDLGWDLRVHYEVKSNLRPPDIAALREAGVVHVQPGIESLVTRVLGLMDKGVRGIRNVRTLRDCESAGLTVSWNWLYGFPGERPADYEPVLRQMPALMHLQPPSGLARILLERFSPYFDDPALGFPRRRAAQPYQHVYHLPDAELDDLVYLFDTDPQGLSEDEATPLHELLRRWSDGYTDSALVGMDTGSEIVISDRRVGWEPREHCIDGPWQRVAYLKLGHGRSVSALIERLVEDHGISVAEAEVRLWLDGLLAHGLVFQEDETWLALATQSEPVKAVRS